MQGQQTYQSNNHKVQIFVTSALLDTTKGHFTYLVTGSDQLGDIQIRRRFNDFYYLRQSLRKKWSGIYIPPVPQKMITGNKDEGNIQMRRRYFQIFLQIISQSKHLFYCSITQQFLRNKSLDMEKFFTTFSYPKTQEMLGQYKTIFQNVDLQNGQKSPTVQQKKVISDFGLYLKKADKQLKNMKLSIQGIVDSRNNFFNNLNIVSTTTLPQYEKNVYSEYLSAQQKQQGLFFADNKKVQQNVQRLKQVSSDNSFQACLDMICYQIRQVEAMQQLFESKEEFQSHYHKSKQKLLSSESQLAKLMGGKTTFKSIFSKGNKDEQIKKLQREIPEGRIQLQNWRRFVNCIVILIAERQIPSFKRFKQLKYYSVLNITSQRQLNYLAVYGQLMKSLMQRVIKVK